MVSVPVRGVLPASTEYVRVPVPLPFAPAVMRIKSALLVAVHAHPVDVDTSTWPEPPAGSAVPELGLKLKVQPPPGEAVPAWVTVKVWPAMVIVPVRAAAALLGATE